MSLFKKSPPRDEAELKFKMGLQYRSRSNKSFSFPLAVKYFQEAIYLNPENPVYRIELARAYAGAPLLAISRGIGELKIKDCLSMAIEELREAVRLNHKSPRAYLILGEVYMYLGQIEKATEAFEAVLHLPVSYFFSDGLVRTYAKRELKHLTHGLSDKPQPETAREHMELAIMHREEQKYDLAELELSRSLRVAPTWSWFCQTACELNDS